MEIIYCKFLEKMNFEEIEKKIYKEIAGKQ